MSTTNAGATKLQRIKRAADLEKSKKATAEARKTALEEEQERIYAVVGTDLGRPILTKEELDLALDTLLNEINADIEATEKILIAEGVTY
jgi:predicted negative regulator of RcsB-dependent stress response